MRNIAVGDMHQVLPSATLLSQQAPLAGHVGYGRTCSFGQRYTPTSQRQLQHYCRFAPLGITVWHPPCLTPLPRTRPMQVVSRPLALTERMVALACALTIDYDFFRWGGRAGLGWKVLGRQDGSWSKAMVQWDQGRALTEKHA